MEIATNDGLVALVAAEDAGDLLPELGAERAVDERVDGRVEDEEEVAGEGHHAGPRGERAQTSAERAQRQPEQPQCIY